MRTYVKTQQRFSNWQIIKCFKAENGKIGVEVALQEKPDLIVCDIMMPVLDGYGVLHLLHKNPEVQYTPFIFLSAKAEREDLRRGMELGADDYLSKPFEGAELLKAIEIRLKKVEEMKKEFTPDLSGLNSLMKINSGRIFSTLLHQTGTLISIRRGN
jgi:DNA-binding response OmpR family regulator